MLVCILEQLLCSIGVVGVIGFAIAWLNRKFYGVAGSAGHRVCLGTGAVGVPIHELGHAFFCVVFRHRIVGMKLFDPKATGGTLGYVRHTWSRRSLYQRIGNFFIGTGPILFGNGVLALLLWWLVPGVFHAFAGRLDSLAASADFGGIASLPAFVVCVFTDYFSPGNWLNPLWWLYTVLACCIALHVDLSKPDIEGALPGALLFAVAVAAPNVILALPGDGALMGYHRWFLTICLFGMGNMLLCLLFSGIAIGVAFGAAKLRTF